MNNDTANQMLDIAERALRAQHSNPRRVQLARHPAKVATPAAAHAALRALVERVQASDQLFGWWQDPQRVLNTALNAALPTEAELAHLLEGEWTVGLRSLQIRRNGSQLMMTTIEEVGPNGSASSDCDVQPAIAQAHPLVGRSDLNAAHIEVAVYSVWDANRLQVVPVAQRLVCIKS